VIALAIVTALVHSSSALWRHARALERRATHRHAHFVEPITVDHFQRGNLHTHSLLSDGKAPIDDMVGWYRDHGYQFVAMTEHNILVGPEELSRFAAPGFVVIPGEEVTNRWSHLPLHVNALCAKEQIAGGTDFDRPEAGLAIVLGQIRAAGGTPLVNHPNFHFALTADDIARGARGRYLLEIWSGHPDVNPAGNALRPSAEAIWDDVLTRGADAFPAAVDDAHGLPGDPRTDAIPGRAWVETFGDETSVASICAALDEGRLYASNGPLIARIEIAGDTFTVATPDADASVTFIGEGGDVLADFPAARAPGRPAVTYRLAGGETFVRARVSDSQGRHAWTAAYRVAG
jgi:hypothetical protein